jgi:hypothetical protein
MLEYQDLEIGFTTSFRLMWNDERSGGSLDGAYWRPIIPPTMPGFYPLGDLGWKGYGDVNGQAFIAIVHDKGTGGNRPALKPPLKFEEVWSDHKSGAKRDGSMWRPVPPEGYVALGLVCNAGYSEPSPEVMRCVRADLVVPAIPGELIWDDRNTGASRDFGSWEIDAPGAPEGEIYFTPGTFIGQASHTKPVRDNNAYALRLRLKETAPTNQMALPKLMNCEVPGLYAPDTLVTRADLPWFAVRDPNLSPLEQLAKSPTYLLERTNRFKLIDHAYNDTTLTQDLEWKHIVGTSLEKATSFTSTTGIELGVEAKVGVAKVSFKLTQSFTYSEGTTRAWSETTEHTVQAHVPSHAALAAYHVESSYILYRQDGSKVSGPVTCSTEQVVWTQFPAKGEPVVVS